MFGHIRRSNRKTIEYSLRRMPETDFSVDKLCGPGFIVEKGETMLNYKCKKHRGRTANNRTDALCIVVTNAGRKRVFACNIQDKKTTTLIPILCANIASYMIIRTDEHKSYFTLSQYKYIHETVCHKDEIITYNCVHIQTLNLILTVLNWK
ncbi:hypothetical protein COBT_000826 [Conglomerata obtusa]